ncbi:MAG: nickel pincer cofactor biosynthesis protein LarB [Planctomycetes bacterium]|nr:nickel pincer cofactor biosynthesis protein LarB [Planctomycetota bacterium]
MARRRTLRGGSSRAAAIPPTIDLDLQRAARCGFPEVVFGSGKTVDEVVGAAVRIASVHGQALVTRASDEALAALAAALPAGSIHRRSRCFSVGDPVARFGPVGLLSAGTSDEPVAEEAHVTLTARAVRVERFRDCGVAGIHRLLGRLAEIRACRCLIVVAGMDGALPSVVGGLVDIPVIACPTSVGYGVAAGGHAALNTMLASCSAGLTVVNIDNGFGAGFAAASISRAIGRDMDRPTSGVRRPTSKPKPKPKRKKA